MPILFCIYNSLIMHPRHPRMHITIDRYLLILSFELNFFCVPTCFHMMIPKSCLSVRTRRKEITNHPGFVNISPTLVIDTSMERSSRVQNQWKMTPNEYKIFTSTKPRRVWVSTVAKVICTHRLSTSSFYSFYHFKIHLFNNTRFIPYL